MRSKRSWLLSIGLLFFALLGALGFLLFDGDLDFGGQYTVLQRVPSAHGKTAFEIVRTDHQALSGPRYAIIVDDHEPSNFELRRALISFWQRRSFELANQKVSIVWSEPNLLILTTDAPDTSPEWLINQSHRIGDVVIQYSGRP